jgi:hypothetical protein
VEVSLRLTTAFFVLLALCGAPGAQSEEPVQVFALLGHKELLDNPEVLESEAAGVSLSVAWDEWFPRRIPSDWADLAAAGKLRMLRVHPGVHTPARLLDIFDGPVDTIPIEWQGTPYRWPKTWLPKYRSKFLQFLTNRVFPILESGDKLAVGFDTVESLEMHVPDEAVAAGLTEPILLQDWEDAIQVVRSGVAPGVELVLNVSPSISDWTERSLPVLAGSIDWDGCNILVGDPEQPTTAQCFLSLTYPGQLGNYMQRNMLKRWLGRPPTVEERRENLIGMWRKCVDWGVVWLEVGVRDILDFPDVVHAMQAGEDPDLW